MSESLQLPVGDRLSVGDRVVYPNQGLCTVEEIKAEHIAGHELVFVSLLFADSGARVKVPETKLAKIGVRRVASRDEVNETFSFLGSDSELASLDWKKRASDNTKLLTTGGLLGLARVVKTLAGLTDLRPLPPKERDQYDDARHLLVHELAAALGQSPADAEDALDLVLFPVGKERPKRSAADFKALGDDELDGELLGLDDEAPDEPDDADEAVRSEAGADAESTDATRERKARGASKERSQPTASGEQPASVATGTRKPKAPRGGRPRQAQLETAAGEAKADGGGAEASSSAAAARRGRPATAAPPSDLDLTRTQTATAASFDEPPTKSKARGRAKKASGASPKATEATAAGEGIATKTEVPGPTEPGAMLEKTAGATSTKSVRATKTSQRRSGTAAGEASKTSGRKARRGAAAPDDEDDRGDPPP